VGVRQPFCDESGAGFGVLLAENSTPFWSHHLISRSDETWLPEWSGKLGGVERCAVRSRGVFGNPQFCIFAPVKANGPRLLRVASGKWRRDKDKFLAVA
jgi:hypothetical protein